MPLRVDQLQLQRGTRLLQSALSFAIKEGEALWVQGPNGVGKSTLLETLCGFRPIHNGDIYWNELSIKSLFDQFHEEIGYLGHKNGLNQNLSVKSAIEFYAQLSGSTNSKSTLEQMGIAALTSLDVRSLSAGQQKRLAIARLLLRPLKIWILDEPSVSLDKGGVNQLQSIINEQLQSGGIVIYTSHVDLGINAKTLALSLDNATKTKGQSIIQDEFNSPEWDAIT